MGTSFGISNTRNEIKIKIPAGLARGGISIPEYQPYRPLSRERG